MSRHIKGNKSDCGRWKRLAEQREGHRAEVSLRHHFTLSYRGYKSVKPLLANYLGNILYFFARCNWVVLIFIDENRSIKMLYEEFPLSEPSDY